MSQTMIDPERLGAAHATVARLVGELRRVLLGKEDTIDEIVAALLARGHVLLEGLPGLGKTELIKALGRLLSLQFRRVQFTPDLLPTDITGSHILQERDSQKAFVFHPGPVFTNLLLADEINRASPKTQAALLEAMQERRVTTFGETRPLPDPFFVLATQNPIELEGTYPLPEAQLDRFLMQIDVLYPDLDAERRMIFETTGAEEAKARAVLTTEELMASQQLVRRMPVGEAVVETILKLVRSLRPGEANPKFAEHIAWGSGPRASQALMLMVRARALLDGRFAPSLDDVEALAVPTLQHRMAVTFAARASEGITVRDLISTALKDIL